MGLGRRRITVADQDRWVFNKMVDAYDARPPYPDSVVRCISEVLDEPVVELGAGQGLLTRPLARRGFRVVAVEPAERMLSRLVDHAQTEAIAVETQLATAESTGLPSAFAGSVVVADAVHFLDAARTGAEVDRILRAGAVVIVSAHLADTPFMRAVSDAIRTVAVRRPVDIDARARQLLAVAGVSSVETHAFEGATDLSREQLHGILRSISFIGPAMNPERWLRFTTELDDRTDGLPRRWARDFLVRVGRKT